MSRRVFISFQHDDRKQAKGFNLMRWAENVDVDFVGRHLLDPVDSQNKDYIRHKVREQMHGTSVTVVLVGEKTLESDWVEWEVDESAQKDNPNGVIAIRLPEVDIPVDGSTPVGAKLRELGAEVLDWQPGQFKDAIERAATASRRASKLREGDYATGGSCGR